MMKYELTSETKTFKGSVLYRIKALKDFSNVRKGDLGGWIQSESNLSQDGDCWIHHEAKVYGEAMVYGNADVFCYARIRNNAKVYGNAYVYDHATVSGYAHVYDNARVHDNAKVYGNAHVHGTADVSSNARVYGNAFVTNYVNFNIDFNLQDQINKILSKEVCIRLLGVSPEIDSIIEQRLKEGNEDLV